MVAVFKVLMVLLPILATTLNFGVLRRTAPLLGIVDYTTQIMMCSWMIVARLVGSPFVASRIDGSSN